MESGRQGSLLAGLRFKLGDHLFRDFAWHIDSSAHLVAPGPALQTRANVRYPRLCLWRNDAALFRFFNSVPLVRR